ncbi:response regulator [Rubritalea sp.]|uniref:response regulator n=1 Tax=Rubritalea sp. TaxID=2109375 RepID=UPI003EFA29DD
MLSRIPIMLVEDHPEYRESLGLVFNKSRDVELATQFGAAEEALYYLHRVTGNEDPGVILLDLNLPAMSGIEAIPEFKKYLPDTPIVVLTQSDREADVLAAISAGASGYLLKSSSGKQIRESIRAVIDGGAPLDPKVAHYILENLCNKRRKTDDVFMLSEREIEVLSLMSEGLVQKQIAGQLAISNHTVGNHIRNIYEKIQVKNAPAAISKAYRNGILS